MRATKMTVENCQLALDAITLRTAGVLAEARRGIIRWPGNSVAFSTGIIQPGISASLWLNYWINGNCCEQHSRCGFRGGIFGGGDSSAPATVVDWWRASTSSTANSSAVTAADSPPNLGDVLTGLRRQGDNSAKSAWRGCQKRT